MSGMAREGNRGKGTEPQCGLSAQEGGDERLRVGKLQDQTREIIQKNSVKELGDFEKAYSKTRAKQVAQALR